MRLCPRLLTPMAALLLAGCTTLGPDFALPEPTWDKDWTSPELAAIALAPAATTWWAQFDDPALDALMAAAVAGNRDLRIAGLRVLEARAQLAIAQSLSRPQQVTATAGAGYGASKPAGADLGSSDFAFANAGIGVAWEIDFWGRFRRGVESADAAYFASIAAQEDFAILLRAEVARLYIAHRTLEEQLAILQQNIALQDRSVQITDLLYRKGDSGELDLQQARTQLLSTQAQVPGLQLSMQQTRNALAVLLGRPAGPIAELALSPPRLPRLPSELAADMPADLLRRRPDVRAAALRAGAQSAQIGIARSDLYPSLVLGGTVGISRTTLGGNTNLLDLGVGPSIRWNIFDFGRIRGNVRVQDARLEQALEAYLQAVLQASVEVDGAAAALVRSREEAILLAQSEQAAARSLDLAQLGFREGLSDFQRVLDAQESLLRQQERAIQNRGQIGQNIVALYKAAGGGWIPATEADFASPETRQRMKARSNWGTLLDTGAKEPE